MTIPRRMAWVGLEVIVGSSVGVTLGVSEEAGVSVGVAVGSGVRVAVLIGVGKDARVGGTFVTRDSASDMGLG
jgi:hypothetical protein